MEKRNVTCIICPKGCEITADIGDTGILDIKGFSCGRGKDYAVSEVTNPTRVLTTTVKIRDGLLPMVPVKSEKPIPKGLLFECMRVINETELTAPVRIGDVAVENILNTGVNIILTRSMDKKESAIADGEKVCSCPGPGHDQLEGNCI